MQHVLDDVFRLDAGWSTGRGHGTPVDDLLPARCCERVQFLGRVRGKWHLPLVVGGRLLKERGVDENAVVKVEVVLVVGGTGWGRDGTQSGGSRMEADKVLARVGVGLMTGDHRRLVPERRRVGTHELDNVPFPRRVQDELTVLPDQPPESVLVTGQKQSTRVRKPQSECGKPRLTSHCSMPWAGKRARFSMSCADFWTWLEGRS